MLFVGWDGGGTSTKVLCMSKDGSIVAQNQFGTLNLNGSSEDSISATISSCLTWMRAQGECASLCVGAAGISNQHAKSTLQSLIRSQGYDGRLQIVGDSDIALTGAVGDSGFVLIAGTGSICIGQATDGQKARCGGFGHILDDKGSGYAIGRDILVAVIRAQDGRDQATELTALVENKLGFNDPASIVTYVHDANRAKSDIAGLAPLLSIAYHHGDHAAETIVRKASKQLYMLVNGAASQINVDNPKLAFLGSILTHCEPITIETTRLIESKLPHVQIIKPLHSASFGAATLDYKYDQLEGMNNG